MAANPHWKRAIGFGKRLSDHLFSGCTALRDPAPPCWALVSVATRRGVHASAYDKNPEDSVRPALVPDDVIQLQPADKYWAPHPATGVFGPPDHDGRRPEPSFSAATPSANTDSSSVPELKAWFRPLEGVDAPPRG